MPDGKKPLGITYAHIWPSGIKGFPRSERFISVAYQNWQSRPVGACEREVLLKLKLSGDSARSQILRRNQPKTEKVRERIPSIQPLLPGFSIGTFHAPLKLCGGGLRKTQFVTPESGVRAVPKRKKKDGNNTCVRRNR